MRPAKQIDKHYERNMRIAMIRRIHEARKDQDRAKQEKIEIISKMEEM